MAKKILLIFCLLLVIANKLFCAQLSGCYTVGSTAGASYTSLTNAGGLFEAINTNGISGAVVIKITSNLNELGTTALLTTSSTASLTIIPNDAVLKVVSYTGACGGNFLRFTSVSNLTIDGSYSASGCTYARGTGNYLQFQSSCAGKTVMRLTEDCPNFKLLNCNLLSDNSIGGIILVDSDQINGSDNLTISNCHFEDSNLPADVKIAIDVFAPTVGNLTGLVISNNTFKNMGGKAVHIEAGTGDVNASTITGNSFYADATIAGPGSAWVYVFAETESGSGHIIRGNYVGGTAPLCAGGKMVVDFSPPATTELAYLIRGLNTLDLSTANEVDSNVFRNISFITSTSTYSHLSIMRLDGGNWNIGTTYGNFIGDATVDASTNASIDYTETSVNNSGGGFKVINSTSPGTINISNNKIGGMLFSSTTASFGSPTAIIQGSNASPVSAINVTSNTIGGVPNNIVKKSINTFRVIYSSAEGANGLIANNTITGVTTSDYFNDTFTGIYVTSASGVSTITGNTLASFTIDDGQLALVNVIHSTKASSIIQSNTIRNFTIVSTYTAGPQFQGIFAPNATGMNISSNSIYNVDLTPPSGIAANPYGILISGAGSFFVNQNYIASLTSTSTDNTSMIRGISSSATGVSTFSNNVVLLSNAANTNDLFVYGIYDISAGGTQNIFNNTSGIKGTNLAAGTTRSAAYYRLNNAIRNVQNNIFSNQRTGSTGAGTSGNYAMYHGSTGGTLTSNYNMLYAEENTNKTVRYSAGDRNFTTWQTSYTFDGNGVTGLTSQDLIDFSNGGKQKTTLGQNAGNASLGTSVAVDFLSVSRPVESGFDIGAYELSTSGLLFPLPVDLINFEAVMNDKVVNLMWTTSSQLNNDYFTIEKSKNAIQFEKLLDVDGLENSTTIVNYLEVDSNPYPGLSYYRLKQTDLNGKYTYSNIVSVNYNLKNKTISVSPNPTDGPINLNLKSFEGKEVLVVLLDMSGVEHYSKVHIAVENAEIIAIDTNNNLTPGTYIVTATSDKTLYSQKIIVK